MVNTVFAEGMGLFHRGSGGIGVAPGDVCLSPPPNAPAPVGYVNVLFAKDLIKGSKSVKIQRTPTALENKSEIAISTGDEPGTQGGGVVTHKTKGKGTFLLWSTDIKAEGKGVCCHGHMIDQNCASSPGNSKSAKAVVNQDSRIVTKKHQCFDLMCGGNNKKTNNKKYNGGAHNCMSKPKGDDFDSHHLPAKAATDMHYQDIPAIQMDPVDHRLTASYGSVTGSNYAAQRKLLSVGRIYDAFLLDIADVRRIAANSGNPAKYDTAIEEAMAYANCLKKEGVIE